jgi:DNA-directed RNA polymerase subunit M/transcription elongation factor TFIIS
MFARLKVFPEQIAEKIDEYCNEDQDIEYELLYHHTVLKENIVELVEKNATGFNNKYFEEERKNQKEQDDFIENPFEVAEGVLTCGKCGSNRTFSYAKQVRSCDEGTSVFATCMNCKNKWVHSG